MLIITTLLANQAVKEKPRNPGLLFTLNKELLLIAFGDFFGNFFVLKRRKH